MFLYIPKLRAEICSYFLQQNNLFICKNYVTLNLYLIDFVSPYTWKMHVGLHGLQIEQTRWKENLLTNYRFSAQQK
jgi:hypothetical protein